MGLIMGVIMEVVMKMVRIFLMRSVCGVCCACWWLFDPACELREYKKGSNEEKKLCKSLSECPCAVRNKMKKA